MSGVRHTIKELFGLNPAEVARILEPTFAQQRAKDAFFGGGLINIYAQYRLCIQADALSLVELNTTKVALELNENLVDFLYDGTDFFERYEVMRPKEQAKREVRVWATVFKAMIWQSTAGKGPPSMDNSRWVPVLAPIMEWIIEEKYLSLLMKENVEVSMPFITTPTQKEISFDDKSISFVASDEGISTRTSTTDSIEHSLGDLTIFSKETVQQTSELSDVNIVSTTAQLSRNYFPTSLPIPDNDKDLPLQSFTGMVPLSLEVNRGITDHIWDGEPTMQYTTFKRNPCETPWQGSICQACGSFRVVPDLNQEESLFFVIGLKHCPGGLNNDWIDGFQRILIDEYCKNKLASLGCITVDDLFNWEYLEEGMILDL